MWWEERHIKKWSINVNEVFGPMECPTIITCMFIANQDLYFILMHAAFVLMITIDSNYWDEMLILIKKNFTCDIYDVTVSKLCLSFV